MALKLTQYYDDECFYFLIINHLILYPNATLVSSSQRMISITMWAIFSRFYKRIKKLPQFLSKCLLTATTNHTANCIWIKRCYVKTISILSYSIRTPSSRISKTVVNILFHLHFPLLPIEKDPNKKWVFHYQQIFATTFVYCIKYLHFNLISRLYVKWDVLTFWLGNRYYLLTKCERSNCKRDESKLMPIENG